MIGWRTNYLGDVDGFTLGGLPEGAQYGKKYGWYMRVYQGEDGYGESYYYSRVTFCRQCHNPRRMSDAGVTLDTHR